MTTERKRLVMERIAALGADITALEAARLSLLVNGYASATLSTGGGSKSYTRVDADKINAVLSAMRTELAALRRILRGGGIGVKNLTVYC